MRPQTVKEKITEVILSLPDDAFYDDIMRELVFETMVDYGIAGWIIDKLKKMDTKAIRRL